MHRNRGFTPLDLLFWLVAVPFLIGLLLPALGASRRTARQMQNNTQLRGIVQGLFTYAQGNKRGGGDGYYPGLTSSGMVAPGSTAGADDTVFSAESGSPANSLALLATGDFIPAGSSDYFINPADTQVLAPEAGDTLRPPVDEQVGNFSYAFLDYGGTGVAPGQAPRHPGRAAEWKETVNTQAAVVSDRNTGGDTEVGSLISSVWTEPNGGDWRGGVARNDASTATETSPILDHLKYGPVANEHDHLFENEPRPIPDMGANDFRDMGMGMDMGMGRNEHIRLERNPAVWRSANAFMATGAHDTDPGGMPVVAAANP